MRTPEQISKIKDRITDPFFIEKFLTEDQVNHLIHLFEQETSELYKVHKNTGPITLDITPFLTDTIVKIIFEKIEEHIGKFELNAGFFFWTDFPHIIHNDDTFELTDVYKAITIPLKLEGDYTSVPSLCFFNQFYFHGPSKFFNGDLEIPSYYNKQVYEYSKVDGIEEGRFDTVKRLEYFTHLKPGWLDGLTFNSAIDWRPTSAIVFDSVRLHCASDFRRLGIKSKLGISIFTRKL